MIASSKVRETKILLSQTWKTAGAEDNEYTGKLLPLSVDRRSKTEVGLAMKALKSKIET